MLLLNKYFSYADVTDLLNYYDDIVSSLVPIGYTPFYNLLYKINGFIINSETFIYIFLIYTIKYLWVLII